MSLRFEADRVTVAYWLAAADASGASAPEVQQIRAWYQDAVDGYNAGGEQARVGAAMMSVLADRLVTASAELDNPAGALEVIGQAAKDIRERGERALQFFGLGLEGALVAALVALVVLHEVLP